MTPVLLRGARWKLAMPLKTVSIKFCRLSLNANMAEELTFVDFTYIVAEWLEENAS